MEQYINKIINSHKNEMRNRDHSNISDAIMKAKFLPGQCCAKVKKAEPLWVRVSSDNSDNSSIHSKMSNSRVSWSAIVRS